MTTPLPLGRVIAILVSLIAYRMASIPLVSGQVVKQPSGGLDVHLPPRLANSTAPPARITAVVVLGEVRDVGVIVSKHGPCVSHAHRDALSNSRCSCAVQYVAVEVWSEPMHTGSPHEEHLHSMASR